MCSPTILTHSFFEILISAAGTHDTLEDNFEINNQVVLAANGHVWVNNIYRIKQQNCNVDGFDVCFMYVEFWDVFWRDDHVKAAITAITI